MKKQLGLCFLLTMGLSVVSYGQEGHWMFYDIANNEKFRVVLHKPRTIVKPRTEGQVRSAKRAGDYSSLGRRQLQSGGELKYRQSYYDIEFYESKAGPAFMRGKLNKKLTEMSGHFANGDKFVARAYVLKPIYQVVRTDGKYKSLRHCLLDGDDKYSVELECKDTGGVGSRFADPPANWLVKPNTFLDLNACKDAAAKLMDESNCGKLRSD